MMTVYADYIAREIKHALEICSEEPQASSVLFAAPVNPIIKKDSVGYVSSSESNYATGPLTKTIYLADEFGTRYKVSVEELKHVKGHGHVTYEEASQLGWFGDGVHWDRKEGIYKENDAEYVSWLRTQRAKWSFNRQVSFDF